MSLGIYPVFEPTLRGDRFQALGEILAANLGTLDEIARSAKLTPLTAYADNRLVPDDFDGDTDELGEAMGEWTDWFEPEEARRVVQGLADYIKSHRKAVKRLKKPGTLVEELEELARVLKVAVAQRARFRLEMS